MESNNDLPAVSREDNGSRDEKGRFGRGNPGKLKGSSKNLMRDEIRSFLSSEWESFPLWFSFLTPKEKIETMLALMPYSVSRLQSVSVTDSQGEDLALPSIDYSRLSEPTLKEILQHTHTHTDNED